MRKKAIITGASRGIGKAIASELAANNYDLVITCHNSESHLKSLAKELEQKYAISCSTFVGDIGNEADVEMLFSTIENVDVLINNAGISYVGLLSEMTFEDWNRVITTNLSSAFLCSKKVIPKMLHNHAGKILNISSVWGECGASMEVAYSASKAGLNGFTKALAKELAPSNIQVNAIACGLIDTDMNACLSSDEMADVINEIPANRIGLPDDVAKLVYQIITANEYLTGQIIKIDGGWI